MNLEEQIKLHQELSKKIAELEEKKQILGISILQQMQSKVLQVPGFLVRQYSRLCIKTSIEEARSLQATKVDEVIDKDKIKMLYNNGEPINGISEVRYIQISEK
jgi:hypothetical protein